MRLDSKRSLATIALFAFLGCLACFYLAIYLHGAVIAVVLRAATLALFLVAAGALGLTLPLIAKKPPAAPMPRWKMILAALLITAPILAVLWWWNYI